MVWTGLWMLADAAGSAIRIAIVGGLLIVVMVLVGGVLIPWLRRRCGPSGDGRDGRSAGGFSIDRLEAMRRDGEIGEAEFRLLRRSAMGLGAKPAKTSNCGSSAPVGGDDDGPGSTERDGLQADRGCEKE